MITPWLALSYSASRILCEHDIGHSIDPFSFYGGNDMIASRLALAKFGR